MAEKYVVKMLRSFETNVSIRFEINKKLNFIVCRQTYQKLTVVFFMNNTLILECKKLLFIHRSQRKENKNAFKI